MSSVKVKVRVDESRNVEGKSFNSLSMDNQIALFFTNSELYIKEALNSKYEEVRSMPRQYVFEYSSSALNRIMNELAMEDILMWLNDDKYKFIIKVLKKRGLEIKEEIIDLLVDSDSWGIRYAIAKRKITSLKNLKCLFLRAIKDFVNCDNPRMLDAVILNPNFRMTKSFEEEIRTVYSGESAEKIFERVATYSKLKHT